MKPIKIILLAALSLCVLLPAAHADIAYTDTFSYTDQVFERDKDHPERIIVRDALAEVTDHYFITPKAIRRDITTRVDSHTIEHTATIARCDTKQRIDINHDLKIFTVGDLNGNYVFSEPTEEDLQANLPTGRIVSNHAVRKLGNEKVLDFDTTIYEIITDEEYSGVLTNRKIHNIQKVWVADIPVRRGCDEPEGLEAKRLQVENLPGATGKRIISYENTGDIDEMSKISQQLILRSEAIARDSTEDSPEPPAEQEDNIFRTEVTSISQDKLDDDIFQIPKGYREVSEEEYEKLRIQALQKAESPAD